MTYQVLELLQPDGASAYAQWFDTLVPDVAAKITTAKLRMQLGNFSNVVWFRGIGEYKIVFGAGWRIYFAKDGLQVIILLGGGSKKTQQRDIDTALALWADYKRRKSALLAAPVLTPKRVKPVKDKKL